MKNLTKILAVAIALIVIAACGPTKPAGSAPAAGGSSGPAPKIKFWSEMNPNVSAHHLNHGETEFAKEWQARTGIDVEFVHFTTDDSFTLLWASSLNDRPDIISYWWTNDYPGGLQGAMDDGNIIRLEEHWDICPNFEKWLDQNPNIMKAMQFPDGSFAGFPSVNGGTGELLQSQGLAIRKDLLDSMGLKVPTTIDEWENVLTEFKNAGLASPYCGSAGTGTATGAFGTAFSLGANDWYIDGTTIKYNVMEPSYKDYLALIKGWYDTGLLDADYMTMDNNTRTARVLDGTGGATTCYWSDMLVFNTDSEIDGFDMRPAPFPVLTAGQINDYSTMYFPYTGSGSLYACISNNKNIEYSCKFMDYLWSPEGIDLANWGIEGVSYTVQPNGTKKLTEIMLNPEEGWTSYQMRGKYMLSFGSGPYWQDPVIPTAGFVVEQQFEARDVWSKNATLAHTLPPFFRDNDVNEEFTTIMADVRTYLSESRDQFILGIKSLNDFDAYIEQARKLGYDRALEIQQDALNEYLKK